jgi:type II secretory pathway predicted ATPase ExeA
MFLEFFKLWDEPFGATPDPAYLYPSPTHLHALDSLRNGIQAGRGFMTLIAEPGMGKTTLLYQLIEQMPQTTKTAYLFQTQCNSLEFMQYLLNEIGVDPSGMGLVAMHRRLNEMLFNEMVQGKQFVLIVDEAQNLSNSVLETIRLLSNFETAHSKLMQIVLAGQSELANKLKQPDLSQLLQRINVMASLDTLTFEETAGYIRHRLKLAGHAGGDIFDPAALAAVYRRSNGIPRNINRICHAALSQAQAEQVRVVTAAIVEKSNRGLGSTVEELQKSRFSSRPTQPPAHTAPAQPSTYAVAPTIPPASMAPPTPVQPEPEPPTPTPPLAQPAVAPTAPPPPPSAPRLIPPPLPSYYPPPEIKRRSYKWLAWTAAVAALPILAALAAPPNVRQALLDKIQPIVRSASSSDSHPAPAESRDASPAIGGRPPAPLATPTGETTRSGVATKGLKIVIDPGHGGDDSGARGPNGLLEKSVCLEVALRLGQMIEDNLPGAEVIYTRNDDQDVSLQRREAIGNEADLFISIHADTLDQTRQIQVYYSDANPRKKSVGPSKDREVGRISVQVAEDIQSALAKQFALRGDVGSMSAPSQAAFAVLNGIRIPAVMVEVPFSEGESPLLDPTQRQSLAEALYKGIAGFASEVAGQSAR